MTLDLCMGDLMEGIKPNPTQPACWVWLQVLNLLSAQQYGLPYAAECQPCNPSAGGTPSPERKRAVLECHAAGMFQPLPHTGHRSAGTQSQNTACAWHTGLMWMHYTQAGKYHFCCAYSGYE